MTPSLPNILQLISFISPILLGFFLFMTSIFNQNIKGFVYLAGLLLANSINDILIKTMGTPPDPGRSMACDMFSLPSATEPAPSSMMIAFTATYLMLPMIYNNQTNISIIAMLLTIFGLDAWTKLQNKCSPGSGIFLGGLVGILLGLTWFTVLSGSGFKKLLYFEETVSNRLKCERPTEQQFKCAVYKNGQLVSNNIA